MKSYQFRCRAGSLIEEYICDKYGFQYNKRQRTHGYYDCYDVNYLYEIKSANIRSDRFVINIKNHKQLLRYNGSYIFVVYDLIDRDKELSVISDIDIKNEVFMNAKDVDGILSNKKVEQYTKTSKNKYQRIHIREIM